MFQQPINNRSKTVYHSLNNPVTIFQQSFNKNLKSFNNRLTIVSESFNNHVTIIQQWFKYSS